MSRCILRARRQYKARRCDGRSLSSALRLGGRAAWPSRTCEAARTAVVSKSSVEPSRVHCKLLSSQASLHRASSLVARALGAP